MQSDIYLQAIAASGYWAQYANAAPNVEPGARAALQGQDDAVRAPIAHLINENCSLARRLVIRVLQELGQSAVANRVEAPDFAAILQGLRDLQVGLAAVQQVAAAVPPVAPVTQQ